MATFNYLPGVQVDTNDGGLVSQTVPTSKATLIIGTSSTGPVNDVYSVVNKATAALTFGLSGTLVKAMSEVAAGGCDNITLFRMGTQQATISGIGSGGYEVTAATITSNGVGSTFTSTNTLSVGQSVTFSDFSGSGNTFLNGQTVLVTAVTGTTFTANVTTSGAVTVSAQTAYATTTGFGFTLGQVAPNTSSQYTLWYKGAQTSPSFASTAVYLYLNGQVVWAQDDTNGIAINTGDSVLVGTVDGNYGLAIGSSTPSAANSVAVGSLTGGSTTTPLPTYVDAVTGLGFTGRQTYIALAEALDILDTFPTEVVYCPDVIVDQPNVAYYVGTQATAINNPATNPNALDWLKITQDTNGANVYQWASESVDSEGNTQSPMSASSAAERVAAGFYEVHPEYLIATFCQLQESVGLNGTCIGFVGTSSPANFNLVTLRNWIGFLPTYSTTVANQPLTAGKGILGIPTLAGCPAGTLNPLCTAASSYRTDGYFLTANGQYDGSVQQDKNGNNIDIGAYLHIVCDIALMSNGYQLNYANNLAGIIAGYYSTIDPKVAITFKPLSVTQLWKASDPQLDSLTQIGVNALRYVGPNQLPVILHGFTVATAASDFTSLLRQSIKGLAIETIRQISANFIGYGNLDGLQQQSLVTALTKNFTLLQQNGYLNNFNFSVTTTAAQLRVGHGSITVTFHPADELVQLTATVGFVPNPS